MSQKTPSSMASISPQGPALMMITLLDDACFIASRLYAF
jgi:hypothetical protein